MNKQRKHLKLWLLQAAIALVAIACSPAGNDNNNPGVPIADETDVATNNTDDEEEATKFEQPLASPAGDAGDEDPPEEDDAIDEGATTGMSEQESAGAEESEPGDRDAVSNEETGTDEKVPAGDGILTGDDRTERQRIISADWNTDFTRHAVPYEELLALLPTRDGIPAIDNPVFISTDEAADWLADVEPVIAFEANGDARAYPLQILTWHEIVNDTVGDIPVSVTFCPLCNSAVVFDRRLDGQVYDFGTSGWLRHSDLVMYDRQTESLWQQFTGEGIVGELAGEQLTLLPSSIVSFADFRQAFPEGQILSRDTGYRRDYGQNPYPGYDAIGQNPFAFIGELDGRLAAMERVITVSPGDVDVAYPLTELVERGVINDTQGGQDLVVFHTGGTASALDTPIIAIGADVGATGVFDPNLNGQKLTFSKEGDKIVDDRTGSTWNILGQAIDGPLTGEALTPIVHFDHFWFSWAAFRPDTIIYGS